MAIQVRSRRSWVWVVSVAGLGVPAFVLRLSGAELEPLVAALIYGVGIVGGAFLLSWAAEVAQLDISAAFALALLALIAVLPEYAIEAVLAWDAGQSFDPAVGEVTREMQRVAANVTGANRLLVGLGWSLVILIYWLRRRQSLDLRGSMRLELTMLVAATLVTFLIFFTNQVHIILAAALIVMYLFYLWVTSTRESEEPELVGAALVIGALPPARRRAVVVVMFLYAAAVILVAAEPFVEALIETGSEFGIDEFILIQWIAPLASESPEIIVAVLFTLRANPLAGITLLISAEVNQLTLLVGSMVGIFSLSAGELLSFPLDSRQSTEFFLTSAVSVFAILLIAPRLVGWRAGAALLVLFIAHLFFVDEAARRIFAYVYLGLAGGLVILDRRRLLQAVGIGIH
ncbi:MAG: hypothetical protein IH862_07020 [Chloroflexi bacterium]|nr:hypothetical protein [Chloroflexota bacterium]